MLQVLNLHNDGVEYEEIEKEETISEIVYAALESYINTKVGDSSHRIMNMTKNTGKFVFKYLIKAPSGYENKINDTMDTFYLPMQVVQYKEKFVWEIILTVITLAVLADITLCCSTGVLIVIFSITL